MIRTQSDHANTELLFEITENTVTVGVSMINQAPWADLWTGRRSMTYLCMTGIWLLLAAAFGHFSL